MDELAKVLDAFILTSDIAEFEARLGLIESFANELANECRVSGPTRLPLARLLRSLCNYYSRFAPLLMQSKDNLREPIEKRLKDEVKLAKWDEQSYYSLVSLLHDFVSYSSQDIALTYILPPTGRVKREEPSQANEVLEGLRRSSGHIHSQYTGTKLCGRGEIQQSDAS